jgi:hypothetical protein
MSISYAVGISSDCVRSAPYANSSVTSTVLYITLLTLLCYSFMCTLLLSLLLLLCITTTVLWTDHLHNHHDLQADAQYGHQLYMVSHLTCTQRSTHCNIYCYIRRIAERS